MTDPKVLERALQRERLRRKEAEHLLEEKSRDLFYSYRELEQALSDLKSNKDQLVQSEKMASLGLMSAGIAHEINNPVGFVLSNINTLGEYGAVFSQWLDLTHKQLAEPSDQTVHTALQHLMAEEDLDEILSDYRDLLRESLEGLNRVKEIVTDLKSFARADNEQFDTLDLNECIANTVAIARTQFKHDCEIIEHYAADQPEIEGSRGKLGQVFMNMVINASQAVTPGVGKITLRSRIEGDYAVVEVQDNGTGISTENQQKLFTPFFTTKEVGEGTGLGLSVSLGIVEDHGGDITVESTQGQGTLFRIRLHRRGKEQAAA